MNFFIDYRTKRKRRREGRSSMETEAWWLAMGGVPACGGFGDEGGGRCRTDGFGDE
jgi:hypothetical protein